MKSSTNKMKEFKNLFFYALITLPNYSCAWEKSQKSDLTDIIIDPSNVQGAFDIADYVSDEFEIIPLETTDESLIARYDKIIYQNGIYYVLDTQTATIFLFDSQGKYMNKLYKQGQGPDEYTRLNDFVVIGSNIWVSDASLQLFIGYDSDFKLIKRNNLWDVVSADHIVFMDNKIYMASNWKGEDDKNMQLASYNIDNDEVNGLIYVPKRSESAARFRKFSQFSMSGDSCLFIYSYCDTIFQIKNNIVVPKYKMVFTERYKDVPYTIEDRYQNPSYKHLIKGIDDIKQLKNNIILEYDDPERYAVAVYDVDKNQANAYDNLTYSNLGDMKIYLRASHVTGGYFITFYEPSVILEDKQEFIPNMKKIKNEADRKKIEQVLANLDPEDNPIIVKFKLK